MIEKWKFYDRVNKNLGNRPSTTPPVMLDTLDSSTSSTNRITSKEETTKAEKEVKEFSDDRQEAGKVIKPISNAKEIKLVHIEQFLCLVVRTS